MRRFVYYVLIVGLLFGSNYLTYMHAAKTGWKYGAVDASSDIFSCLPYVCIQSYKDQCLLGHNFPKKNYYNYDYDDDEEDMGVWYERVRVVSP
jgi:hypothetical protein